MENQNSEKRKQINLLCSYAEFGLLEELRYLLEKKNNVDVNSVNELGYTALHKASNHGHKDVVVYLISLGANVNCKVDSNNASDSNATPIFYSVKNGHIDITELLIHHSADTRVVVDGCNLLDIAVESGNTEVITLMLKLGFDINQYDAFGLTPLARSLKNDHYESTKLLLERGADYEKYCTNKVLSPIHYAVGGGRNKCIKLLLNHVEKEKGTEGLIEYLNYNSSAMKRTPLHLACFDQNYHGVKLLLKYGANPNLVDSENLKPSDLLQILGDTHASNEIRLALNKANDRGRY